MSSLFALVTSGYRVRLDFPDGKPLYLGPASGAAEVAVRPPSFWRALWIFLNPGLRAGEGFVQGYWEITHGDLATFLRIIQAPRRGLYARLYQWVSGRRGPIFWIRQRLFTDWNRHKVPEHYNVGNELYSRMLDSTEQYSCAFFSLASHEDLEEAQKVKLATSIERLRLDQSGLRVLDIGCGSGALAAEIAQQPGNHDVLGISVSEEQLKAALARRDRLPAHVRLRLKYNLSDYRDFLSQRDDFFDRIISIGMFEHVGLGRHIDFFTSIEHSLRSDGRALIHSIVRPSPGADNEWIRRYIFPGSFLPSVAELVGAAEKGGLIVDAIHIHPPSDYRKTIQAWRRRFEAAWPEIQRMDPEKYNAAFGRMWTFYLASVETIFTEDLLNFRIAQIELRKPPGQLNLA